MMYALGVVVVIGVFALWVAAKRRSIRQAPAKLRGEIRAYVEARGGKVTFHDDDSMTIEGPRRTERRPMLGLRMVVSDTQGEMRERMLALSLRDYFPDKMDEMLEQSAQKRLADAKDAILALSPDELKKRLRVKIVSERASNTGLATCARRAFDGFEARVVLDGFDLDGMPEEVRARLSEDDAAVFSAAIDATLGAPPSFESGEVDGHAWLAVPERILGARDAVIAACGKKLVWIAPSRDGASNALATLANRSLETGSMKGVLAAWTGGTLARIGMMTHTIKGPTTPDFTLELPPSLLDAFGLTPDERGRVGVSRA